MLKNFFTFFVLLIFIVIGFGRNSIMSFAMQSDIHQEIMGKTIGKMKNNCCNDEKKDKKCNDSCCVLKIINFKNIFLNNNFQKKNIKIKIFSFVNISDNTSYFLENKNLIKNTSSPPNLNKKIKNYSYTDLIKIIKSNT